MDELIQTIIEYLPSVPGVVSVEVVDSITQEGIFDIWDKKVFITFAGCDEPVVLEIY